MNGPCIAEFGHTNGWGVSIMKYERYFGFPIRYRYSKVFQCHQFGFFKFAIWWNIRPYVFSDRSTKSELPEHPNAES